MDIKTSYWTQSLFHRTDFRKHTATTGKMQVPDAVKSKIALTFYHEIVQKIRRAEFHHCL